MLKKIDKIIEEKNPETIIVSWQQWNTLQSEFPIAQWLSLLQLTGGQGIMINGTLIKPTDFPPKSGTIDISNEGE